MITEYDQRQFMLYACLACLKAEDQIQLAFGQPMENEQTWWLFNVPILPQGNRLRLYPVLGIAGKHAFHWKNSITLTPRIDDTIGREWSMEFINSIVAKGWISGDLTIKRPGYDIAADCLRWKPEMGIRPQGGGGYCPDWNGVGTVAC